MAVEAAVRRVIAEARERREAAERAVETALGQTAPQQPRAAPPLAPEASQDVVFVGGAPVPADARGPHPGAHLRVAGRRSAAGAGEARNYAGGSTVEPPVGSGAQPGSGAPAQAAVAGCSGGAAGRANIAAAAEVPSPSAAPRSVRARSRAAKSSTQAADGRRGSKGKGTVWSVAERVALSKAFVVATLNSVSGADQDGDDFWADIFKGFVEQMPPNLPRFKKRGRWGDRKWSCGKVELLRNIGPCAQRYAHFYYVAGSDALTGNLDEDGVRRAARALYSAASSYKAARKDCSEEEALERASKPLPERRARKIPESWQPCWEELRVLDKWSGAAADPEIAALLEAEGNGSGSTASGAGKRPPLQENPFGTKAEKRQARSERDSKAEEYGLSQALLALSEAIKAMVASISKRAAASEAAQRAEKRHAAAEYFNSPEVRDTPETKEFRANLHQETVLLGRSALASSRQACAEAQVGASRQQQATGPPQPVLSSNTERVQQPIPDKRGSSRGASAVATKVQHAMRRRPVVDLIVSTAAPAFTGQDVGLPTTGGLASGIGARAEIQSEGESLYGGMEASSMEEEGEGSE